MSDWLYKELKQEANRFCDISSVLQNVNEKGYLALLEEQLASIFQTEIAFASKKLKQLIDQMRTKGKAVDFNEQFIRNMQIFKANFDIILEKLSNSIWKNITLDFYEKMGIKQEIRIIDDLDMASSKNFQSVASQISVKSQNNSRSPSQKVINAKSSTFIQQGSSEKNRPKYTKINNLQRNSATSESRSPHRDQNNMSVSSMKSFNSKNGQPVPFSEISMISGNQSSFPQAKRNLDNSLTTSSPGVGKYKIEAGLDIKVICEHSPSVKIGLAPKISWIDERLAVQDSHSPGPKYDVSHHFCSKPLKK